VDLEPVLDPQDTKILAQLVSRHLEETGSPRAKYLLDNWAEVLPRFVKVFPHEFKRVLGVPRVRQAYVPGQVPMPVVAEQVQHG
jgi:glutamate synthase domain-containing protein 3